MMRLPGLGGALFPGQFLGDGLADAAARLDTTAWIATRRRHLQRWWQRVAAECGPATGLRALHDLVATPLFGMLGFRHGPPVFDRDSAIARLETRRQTPVGLLLLPWATRLPLRWRDAIDAARAAGATWTFVLAPPYLSLVDAAGPVARRTLDVTFPDVFEPHSVVRFLLLCRTDAFDASANDQSALRTWLAAAIDHQDRVRRDLEDGVATALDALGAAIGHGNGASGTRFAEALTLVYRILFLLFAESRDMVPRRHPIYQRGYAIGELCREALRSRHPAGLWDGLASVTRLSRTGVDAGDLIVRPFNGQLFARAAAPSLEPPRPQARATLATAARDAALGRALVALGSRSSARGRETIAYADLGVEQLGAVYERVLDLDGETAGATTGVVTPTSRSAGHSLERKRTGTFYTPQSLTEFVVRRTLAPLVEGASADAILSLRIVDPAMGSGAFLVAACHYLSHAYERAIVEEGQCAESDLDDDVRAGMRRLIAERCLAGVDRNPVAVQVARLSLWLTTLARGKPLNFLDHRLRTGNSLVGTAPDELTRIGASGRATNDLPLLDPLELEHSLGGAARPLRALVERRDDTVDVVREKEKTWLQLAGERSPLAPWRMACHIWCAPWFLDGAPMSPPETRALRDAVLNHDPTIAASYLARRLNEVVTAAERQAFFHWPLEFADVFYDDAGQPKPRAGFDAVIGNPPWEMLREESARTPTGRSQPHTGGDLTSAARHRLSRFIRESGLYQSSSHGHLNLYQPFIERALQILRPGGRLGLVLPWGLATDDGAGRIRARLIDTTAMDTLIGLENSQGIFPVHRGLRFMVVTTTTSRPPRTIRAKFGVRSPKDLDALPGRDDPLQTAYPIRLTREQLAAVGGPLRRIPDLRRPADLRLLERLSASYPGLGSEKGWRLRFGRELNATDDRESFGSHGLPVIDGKHIQPFVASPEQSQRRIREAAARSKLPDGRFRQPRLAYRDVSAAGNRLSLIAAIVPAGVVTTHSLFCLRTPLSPVRQQFLCGLFNSFVLNAVVRIWMGSHVTTSLVESLPVPVWTGVRPQRLVAYWARRLSHRPESKVHSALQAVVAMIYGLDREAFAELLEGFPLVALEERRLALDAMSGDARAVRIAL